MLDRGVILNARSGNGPRATADRRTIVTCFFRRWGDSQRVLCTASQAVGRGCGYRPEREKMLVRGVSSVLQCPPVTHNSRPLGHG